MAAGVHIPLKTIGDISVLQNLRNFNNKCDSLPDIGDTYTQVLDELVSRLEAIQDKPEISETISAIVKELKDARLHTHRIDRLRNILFAGGVLNELHRKYAKEFSESDLRSLIIQVRAFIEEHEA